MVKSFARNVSNREVGSNEQKGRRVKRKVNRKYLSVGQPWNKWQFYGLVIKQGFCSF